MRRADSLEIDHRNKADQLELLRLRLQVKQFAAQQQQHGDQDAGFSNSLSHIQVSLTFVLFLKGSLFQGPFSSVTNLYFLLSIMYSGYTQDLV